MAKMSMIVRLKQRCKEAIDVVTRQHIARLFLVGATLIGGAFVVVTPPFQGWDETEHFYRAYQVSELNLRADTLVAQNVSQLPGSEGSGSGGYIPQNIVTAVRDLRFHHDEKGAYIYSDIGSPAKNSTDYTQKVPTRFDNTAIYSPMGYIPQALVIAFARLIEVSPIAMFYAARIAGLIAWIGLMYAAIKITPRGKKLFVLFALNPVAIFVAATLSPDAYAAACIALSVAIGMRLRHSTLPIKHAWLYVAGLVLAVLVAVMIKNVYLPVVLLALLIPSSILGIWYKSFIIAVVAAIGILWNVSIAYMTQTIPSYFTIIDHINAKDQLLFILEHPLKFIAILFWNIFGTNSILFNFTYNGTLVENKLPAWTITAWGVGFLYVVLARTKDSVGYVRDRLGVLLPLGIYAAVVCLIVASMYIGWTPVGSKDIIGVQGRYFIPISFLLVPILMSKRLHLFGSTKTSDMVVFGVLAMALVAVVLSILVRYTLGVSSVQ